MLIYSNRWENCWKQQLDTFCIPLSFFILGVTHRYSWIHCNPSVARTYIHLLFHQLCRTNIWGIQIYKNNIYIYTYIYIYLYTHILIYTSIYIYICVIYDWHASMGQSPVKVENLQLYAVDLQNGQFNQVQASDHVCMLRHKIVFVYIYIYTCYIQYIIYT